MDQVVVCVMSQTDVRRLLLGDPRIATRIAETMGRRLGELERRLSDTVVTSVPERVAATPVTLAQPRSLLRGGAVRITHEQLAVLAGTSREATTTVLGDLAGRHLVVLGRVRITVLDLDGLRALGG